MTRSLVVLTLSAALVSLSSASTAWAQGGGRPKLPARAAGGDTTTGPQFGSWLEDAGTAAPGQGWTSVSFGYWRSREGRQVGLPMMDVGYVPAPRLQLSVSVPWYHARYGSYSGRGLDDVHVSAKLNVLDPARRTSGFGLAVIPLVEVLSDASVGPGERRTGWALPVSAEARTGPVRLYGTAGYFSRGSVFGAGALEWTAPNGSMVTWRLSHAYSTSFDASTELANSRQRLDAGMSLAHPVASSMVAYGSVGRTLSRGEGRTTLSLAGGIGFRFDRR